MVVIRMVFKVKMGNSVEEVVDGAKRSAEMLQEAMGSDIKMRILTDLSGPFNTVVQEMEMESLAAWEQFRARLFASPEFQEQQANSPMPFESGRVEFYTLEAVY
jgi:hypothetical protein